MTWRHHHHHHHWWWQWGGGLGLETQTFWAPGMSYTTAMTATSVTTTTAMSGSDDNAKRRGLGRRTGARNADVFWAPGMFFIFIFATTGYHCHLTREPTADEWWTVSPTTHSPKPMRPEGQGEKGQRRGETGPKQRNDVLSFEPQVCNFLVPFVFKIY